MLEIENICSSNMQAVESFLIGSVGKNLENLLFRYCGMFNVNFLPLRREHRFMLFDQLKSDGT